MPTVCILYIVQVYVRQGMYSRAFCMTSVACMLTLLLLCTYALSNILVADISLYDWVKIMCSRMLEAKHDCNL